MEKTADGADIWQAFKQGDRQAYATLYHQYVQSLFQYGYRLCSDRERVKDAIQDIFFYLWEHRSGLGNVQHPQYYLFRALRRKILVSNKSISFSQLSDGDAVDTSFEAQWMDEETKANDERCLHRGLQQLTERQREAIFLKYYQNMPVDNIARLMNIQRRAVYQLLSKAIQALSSSWLKNTQDLVKIVGWVWVALQIV
ncbi:MAG: sigma-70 family RNA polymerase sigma factor [Bacteroidota bacterium]